MTDVKQLAAITALNEMMSGGHFNICTVDRVAKMLGVNPKGEAYDILHSIHCVDFAKMPRELVDEIPVLIGLCLSVAPTFQFKRGTPPPPPIPPPKRTVTEAPPKLRLLSFFSRRD